MRNGFVCCTPYHVMLSVHLAMSKYQTCENEIFVCDHFVNSDKVYENLKKIGVFSKVYYVRDNYLKSNNKKEKLHRFFFRKYKDMLSTENVNFNYDNLFIYTYTFFSILAVDLVKLNNKNSKINLVEDGIGTYLANFDSVKNKVKKVFDVIFRTFLNYRLLNPWLISKIYLFDIDLYSGTFKDRLERIPNINKENNNYKEKINYIFNYYNHDIYKKAKFIYFDQCFSLDNIFSINEKHIVKDIITIFRNLKIDNNLIIKLHPRDHVEKYKELNFSNVNNSSFPWELICLNENVGERIFISVNSSAVFSPSILFGNHNVVILLYKLYNFKNENFEFFIKNLISKNKITVYIPETLEELSNIIKKYI